MLTHLTVLQPNVSFDKDPTQATDIYPAYRTDFHWNKDFTAFKAIPLRWFDDASYAAYQGEDLVGEAEENEALKDFIVLDWYDINWDHSCSDEIPF